MLLVLSQWLDVSCLNLLLRKLSSSKGGDTWVWGWTRGKSFGTSLMSTNWVLGMPDNHQQGQSCCLWCCHSGLMWVVSISASQFVFMKRGWHLGVGMNWGKSFGTSLMSINWVQGMPEIISKDKAAAYGAVIVAWCELSQSLLRKLSSSKSGWHLGVGMNWWKSFGTPLMSTNWVLGMPEIIGKEKSAVLWCCHSGLIWVVSISASQVVFIKIGDDTWVWQWTGGRALAHLLCQQIGSLGCQKSLAKTKLLLMVLS